MHYFGQINKSDLFLLIFQNPEAIPAEFQVYQCNIQINLLVNVLNLNVNSVIFHHKTITACIKFTVRIM